MIWLRQKIVTEAGVLSQLEPSSSDVGLRPPSFGVGVLTNTLRMSKGVLRVFEGILRVLAGVLRLSEGVLRGLNMSSI